jgi:mannan endo-1,4-beta-mannosidase
MYFWRSMVVLVFVAALNAGVGYSTPVSAASAYASAVLADSPVAYWRLGETSGTTATDATGHGHNLTYVGASLAQAGAISGDTDTAIALSGTTGSYVSQNSFTSFPTTAITVGAWVKTTSAGTGIFSYAVSGNANQLLLYSPENIHLTDGSVYLTTGVAVNDGLWHYLAWTWRASDGQTQLYKDGALAYTGKLSAKSIPSSGALVLGQDQDTLGGGFQTAQAYHGSLDEVALFGATLSAAQIQTLYADGHTVSTSSSAGVYLGVSISGVPSDMTKLTTFENDAGKHMAIVSFWRSMGGSQSTLYTSWLQNVRSHGSTPMITWLPENSDGGSQTAYSLSSIASGSQDSIITSWAQQLKSYGGRVLIRWAHEMNGSWYAWGRQPTAYISAWRHIHNIFAQQGATNVQWVWSPNTRWSDPASDFLSYYPGDAYVDWTSLDSYNKPSNGSWMTFSQLFSTSYGEITQLTSKPLMIGETSSAEASLFSPVPASTKAAWITATFGSTIPAWPRIKALVWMNDNLTASEGCCNWAIESSTTARSAFAAAIAPSMYVSSWPS